MFSCIGNMKLVTWNGDWRDNAMPLTIDVTSKQYKHCFWFLLGRVDDVIPNWLMSISFVIYNFVLIVYLRKIDRLGLSLDFLLKLC